MAARGILIPLKMAFYCITKRTYRRLDDTPVLLCTDNIVKSRVLDISADVVQMEESLIFFRILRLLVLRQHRLEFQTDQD